ncbi:hypothetical protein DUT91_01070 [Phyllobacterium salinisoli]|uniref:Uncharacterized protein n=1 Tax=Phyllobacterium salinisoli TaxID=1899321 RepID=A0A368K9F5_9HYPH|nr:hypothetical protein DUT91_01070 [Phyllobacterium salinisoli]
MGLCVSFSWIKGNKKGPRGSLVCRAWEANAGWLHHPAHARSYYNKNCLHAADSNSAAGRRQRQK